MKQESAAQLIYMTCHLPRPREDYLREFALAESLNKDLFCHLGAALTRRGRDCLVHYYMKQLFVLELRADQASRLGLGAHCFQAIQGHRLPEQEFAPAISIEAVDIGPVIRRSQVHGQVTVRSVNRVPEEIAVQIGVVPDNCALSVWSYSRIMLHGQAEISFDFSLDSIADQLIRVPGPIAMFAHFCTPAARRTEALPGAHPAGGMKRLSNIVGTVVDI